MIGERLKEVRRYFNSDTQEDLAQKLNVTKSTIQSWEQGKSSPSHEMLIAMCQLYNVTSDYLLGLTDTDPLFSKQVGTQLTPENYSVLKRFEAFLLHEQKTNQTKGRR